MVSRSPLDGPGRIHFDKIFVRASVGGFVFNPQAKTNPLAGASREVRGEWQGKEGCLLLGVRRRETDGDHCHYEGRGRFVHRHYLLRFGLNVECMAKFIHHRRVNANWWFSLFLFHNEEQ